MLILISTLAIDVISSNIYDLISRELSSSLGIAFFISISVVVLIVGLILLLRVIKQQSEHLRTTNMAFNRLYKLVVLVQFMVSAVFVFMVTQMVSTSQYFVAWLSILIILSAIPTYISLGLLALRFFSWSRSGKRNMIVLLYGLGTAFLLVGNLIIDISIDNIFSETPLVKKPSVMQFQYDLSSINPSHSMTAINGIVLKLGLLLLVISYIFLWTASAILLHRYSHRLGKSSTYWTIIFLPPIFFLIGLLPTLVGISSANFAFFDQDLILFRVLATLASIAGGVLFGVSFLVLARSMRQVRMSNVADYLSIAGYGITLLTLISASNILFNPYPPVGMASCSSMALASYVFYLGIYSSAISISEDSELRKAIRRTAVKELKILDTIGTAQVDTQLQDKVAKLVKEYSDKMNSEVGVQVDLSEHEAKLYLDEVIAELDKHHTSK
jgi:hypothetical protein